MREYIVDLADVSAYGRLMIIGNGIPNKELIRCKDCKHRPTRLEEDEDAKGFNLKFPDEQCPCYCDDGYYNWMPSDDWYCGNGERK